MAKKKHDPLTIAPLQAVLDELKIPSNWDAVIIGDGSGTDWKCSCGWSAVLIDHYGNYRAPFWGCSNTGTSQLAEFMPYLWALLWYSSGPGAARLNDKISLGVSGDKFPGVNIHIITDNKNIANQGNGLAQRKAYSSLWKIMDGFNASGYKLEWHWIARMRLGLNRLVDTMASKCRVTMEQKINLPADVTLYDFNPTDEQFEQASLEETS